jgi:hypothetical protein
MHQVDFHVKPELIIAFKDSWLEERMVMRLGARLECDEKSNNAGGSAAAVLIEFAR